MLFATAVRLPLLGTPAIHHVFYIIVSSAPSLSPLYLFRAVIIFCNKPSLPSTELSLPGMTGRIPDVSEILENIIGDGERLVNAMTTTECF